MKKIVIALCIASSLLAYEGFGSKGAFKSLNLTAEQQKNVEALFAASKDGHQSAVAASFGESAFDRDAFINAQHENIEKSADFFAALHAILTPEQRKAFAINVAQKRSHKSDHVNDHNKDKK